MLSCTLSGMSSPDAGTGASSVREPCVRDELQMERSDSCSSVEMTPGATGVDASEPASKMGVESACADDDHVDWNALAGGASSTADWHAGSVDGVYMVGAGHINSYEVDLKYEYANQQIYLIRDAIVRGLHIPEQDRAEVLAFGMIADGQASWDQLQRLMAMLPADTKVRWSPTSTHLEQEHPPKRFTVGAWNYGNMAGITRQSRAFPWVTKVLAGIVRTWHPSLHFTSCTLSLNSTAPLHKDSRNLKDSCNFALPCSAFRGGQIFLEDVEGLTSLTESGPVGHVLSMNEATAFSPHQRHATLPWSGQRLLLLAYHIGQFRSLTSEAASFLCEHGFHMGPIQK